MIFSKSAIVFFLVCAASLSAHGRDTITFTSGTTVTCTVVEYSEGTIHVIDETGEFRSAPIESIQRIVFSREREERRGDGDDDKVYNPEDIIAGADNMQDRMAEVSGFVEKTERDSIRDDHFRVFLQGGLIVQMERERFENLYFELKELERHPRYRYSSQPYYEMRFSRTGGFSMDIILRENRREYDSRRRRWNDVQVDSRNILNPGDRIRVRGTVRSRGGDVFLKDARLIDAE